MKAVIKREFRSVLSLLLSVFVGLFLFFFQSKETSAALFPRQADDDGAGLRVKGSAPLCRRPEKAPRLDEPALLACREVKNTEDKTAARARARVLTAGAAVLV